MALKGPLALRETLCRSNNSKGTAKAVKRLAGISQETAKNQPKSTIDHRLNAKKTPTIVFPPFDFKARVGRG